MKATGPILLVTRAQRASPSLFSRLAYSDSDSDSDSIAQKFIIEPS